MLAGDTWAHGQLNQSSLITTILAAGEVGLALGELGGSPVVALAVPGAGVHLLATNTLDSVKGALERVLVVGHGLKRLLALLNQNGVFPTQLFDTQIAWQLLDGHRHDDERFFSLENARPGAGIAALPADTPHRERLCADAEHVLGLKQALRSELSQHGLEHVAALEFALLPVVVEIEATGVAVDAVAWAGVRDEYNREARALAGKLKASLGVRNVDDDLQVLAGLQCLGLPVTQTSRIALAQYSDRPVVEQLARYRRLIGFVRSSGKAVLEAVAESADGRVHTNIHQLGAKTGRMSCSAPNLMGLPRDVEIRACIVAPYGKKLIVGDYKAIEMRVIADQTGDAALREVFLRGGCPHKHTASILTGTPEASATDEQKNHAKPLNFGLCFGMSSPTLVPYARKNFRVVMTEAEAEQFKNKFFDHYSGVREWHARTRAQAPMQLRTRSGRVTYYLRTDEGFNARLSYPVQGTAADGMKAAIVLLHPRLARFGARIVLVVHDEVVVEVPDEHAEEVRLLVRECMIAGMQPYVPSVPIIVEPEVRRSWAV
jgi:DNA polymerase-1